LEVYFNPQDKSNQLVLTLNFLLKIGRFKLFFFLDRFISNLEVRTPAFFVAAKLRHTALGFGLYV